LKFWGEIGWRITFNDIDVFFCDAPSSLSDFSIRFVSYNVGNPSPQMRLLFFDNEKFEGEPVFSGYGRNNMDIKGKDRQLILKRNWRALVLVRTWPRSSGLFF